jgi:hypothetical protein
VVTVLEGSQTELGELPHMLVAEETIRMGLMVAVEVEQEQETPTKGQTLPAGQVQRGPMVEGLVERVELETAMDRMVQPLEVLEEVLGGPTEQAVMAELDIMEPSLLLTPSNRPGLKQVGTSLLVEVTQHINLHLQRVKQPRILRVAERLMMTLIRWLHLIPQAVNIRSGKFLLKRFQELLLMGINLSSGFQTTARL